MNVQTVENRDMPTERKTLTPGKRDVSPNWQETAESDRSDRKTSAVPTERNGLPMENSDQGESRRLSRQRRAAYRVWLRSQSCACDGLNQHCSGQIVGDEQGLTIPLSLSCGIERGRLGDRDFALRYLLIPLREMAEAYRTKWESRR